MCKKQVNFRLSEVTLKYLDKLVENENIRLSKISKEYGLISSEANRTSIIEKLIMDSYRKEFWEDEE